MNWVRIVCSFSKHPVICVVLSHLYDFYVCHTHSGICSVLMLVFLYYALAIKIFTPCGWNKYSSSTVTYFSLLFQCFIHPMFLKCDWFDMIWYTMWIVMSDLPNLGWSIDWISWILDLPIKRTLIWSGFCELLIFLVFQEEGCLSVCLFVFCFFFLSIFLSCRSNQLIVFLLVGSLLNPGIGSGW